MNKKLTALILAGSSLGILGGGLVSGAHATGVATPTDCPAPGNQPSGAANTTATYSPIPTGDVRNLPDGGQVWTTSPTTGAGSSGIKGTHGYLEANGSAGTHTGHIVGRQTESTFNGYLGNDVANDGNQAHLCAGAQGRAVDVSGPKVI